MHCHARLSTWVNTSVDPTQIAEWAGNSVNVLLLVCAQCIAGGINLTGGASRKALRDDSNDGMAAETAGELLRVFSGAGRSRPVQTGHNRTERQAAPGRVRPGPVASQSTFPQVVAGDGFEPS